MLIICAYLNWEFISFINSGKVSTIHQVLLFLILFFLLNAHQTFQLYPHSLSFLLNIFCPFALYVAFWTISSELGPVYQSSLHLGLICWLTQPQIFFFNLSYFLFFLKFYYIFSNALTLKYFFLFPNSFFDNFNCFKYIYF